MKSVRQATADSHPLRYAVTRTRGRALLTTRIGIAGLLACMLSACDSGGTSSSGGDPNEATSCVTRSLKTVYVNECEYDVNVILLEKGERHFRVKSDDASTRSVSNRKFGACRVPSIPILNSDADGFRCSKI